VQENVKIKPYGLDQNPRNVVILDRNKEDEIFKNAEKIFRITGSILV
jgi:hypothetical protein